MKTFALLLASIALASATPAFAESRAARDASAGNAATVSQTGDNNRLSLQQRGSDLSADITQTGDDNRLKLKQFGEGETAVIAQTGGEHFTIVQGSPGNGRARRVGMQRHLN